MRRVLLSISIVCLMLLFLVAALGSFRYVNSGAQIFQIATLMNFFLRPIVAIIVVIVLAVRLRDIWTCRINLNTRAESRVARFAQTTGILLLLAFYVLLAVVLTIHFGASSRTRAELPLFFIFGPLLVALPVGYMLFELGRLIECDRHAAGI